MQNALTQLTKSKASFKKSNKLKGKKVISQIKINIPTYKKNNIPNSLKDIPISKPGSRYIK